MGCWNGTCGVTRLPLNSGEPIRAFILVPKEYFKGLVDKENNTGLGGGLCYSSPLYSPFGPALKGKYDDYGGINDIEDRTNTKLITGYLNDNIEKLFSTSHSDFTYYKEDHYDRDSYFKDGLWTILGLMKLIERGKTLLSMMLVHEFAYQELIKESDKVSWDWTMDYLPTLNNIKEDVELYCNHFKKTKSVYEKIKDKIFKDLNKKELEIYFKFKHTSHDFEKIPTSFKKGHSNLVAPNQAEDGRVDYLIHSWLYAPYVREAKRLPKDFIEDYSEMFKFSSSFSILRALWMPQSGAGSQSNGLSLYRDLTESSANYIKTRIDDIKSNYE